MDWPAPPTDTIFSIHLVGLNKHDVLEVYQTLRLSSRAEGELNHLIAIEYFDTLAPQKTCAICKTVRLKQLTPLWFDIHTPA